MITVMHGSEINMAALKHIKSLVELEKLEIFSHLPNAAEANKELWETLKPKEPEKPKG